MKGAGGVTACYRESAMNFATTHAKILTDEVKLERPRDHRFRHAASIDDQQNLHDKSTNAAPAPAAFTNTLGLLSLSVAPASKTSSLTSCSRLATAPPPRGTAAPRVPVVPLSVTRAENRAILLERLKKRPAVPQVGPVTPTPAPAPALSRQTAMAGVAPSPLTLVAHLSAPTSLSPQPMPLTLALSTPVAERLASAAPPDIAVRIAEEPEAAAKDCASNPMSEMPGEGMDQEAVDHKTNNLDDIDDGDDDNLPRIRSPVPKPKKMRRDRTGLSPGAAQKAVVPAKRARSGPASASAPTPSASAVRRRRSPLGRRWRWARGGRKGR